MNLYEKLKEITREPDEVLANFFKVVELNKQAGKQIEVGHFHWGRFLALQSIGE